MAQPFVVFALPRCRTAWLSRFLAYGGWQCGHDELRHCRSLEDVRSWLALPNTGTVETGAAPFWRMLPENVTAAVIRRPLDEVMASLWRGGLTFDAVKMARHLGAQDAKLRQLAHRRPGVLCTTFAELGTEEGCARLFEHCLPYRHDSSWWQALAPVNMQVSIPHMRNYFLAHQPQVDKLRRIAKHEMLRAFRRPVEMEGIVFQQETLAQIMPDLDGPAGEECALLGEAPEAWPELMNIPLLRRLVAGGGLHIMTARSNGRLFGYLVSALGEAFHAHGQIEAEQAWFFADPTWPGLGRKLQHASIEDLRAKGVTRVMMLNLDGSRVGSLYRRLGAKETGQRYVLELR
jgi:hypothetical protein